MNGIIITVGSEIILGDILNTNSQFLSQELNEIGIDVFKHISVGDNKGRLIKVLEEEITRNDILILTGGLGPTDDDITKETVAEFLQVNLLYNEECYNWICEYLKRINITENNKKQAYVIEGAKIIHNDKGTAPGLIVEKENKKIILLPGPPNELINMWNKSIKPYLKSNLNDQLSSKYVRFFGIGESQLESELHELIKSQINPTLALYAKKHEVVLRITAKGHTKATCEEKINSTINKLTSHQKYIYSIDDDMNEESKLSKIVYELLVKNNITIATAESLTGGLLASTLIDNSGISQFFKGSLVVYNNDVKAELLNVDGELLITEGAVSKKCAIAMAENCRMKFNSDLAISTTGVAGPASDNKNNPVGKTFIALATRNKTYCYEYLFNGDRQNIREKTVLNALAIIRNELIVKY